MDTRLEHLVFLLTFLLLGVTITQGKRKPSFDCPEEFGSFPDKEDCTKYYVCVFGEVNPERCSGGLMFNTELETCDWQRNIEVDCRGNRVGTDQDGENGEEFFSRRQPDSLRLQSQPRTQAATSTPDITPPKINFPPRTNTRLRQPILSNERLHTPKADTRSRFSIPQPDTDSRLNRVSSAPVSRSSRPETATDNKSNRSPPDFYPRFNRPAQTGESRLNRPAPAENLRFSRPVPAVESRFNKPTSDDSRFNQAAPATDYRSNRPIAGDGIKFDRPAIETDSRQSRTSSVTESRFQIPSSANYAKLNRPRPDTGSMYKAPAPAPTRDSRYNRPALENSDSDVYDYDVDEPEYEDEYNYFVKPVNFKDKKSNDDQENARNDRQWGSDMLVPNTQDNSDAEAPPIFAFRKPNQYSLPFRPPALRAPSDNERSREIGPPYSRDNGEERVITLVRTRTRDQNPHPTSNRNRKVVLIRRNKQQSSNEEVKRPTKVAVIYNNRDELDVPSQGLDPLDAQFGTNPRYVTRPEVYPQQSLRRPSDNKFSSNRRYRPYSEKDDSLPDTTKSRYSSAISSAKPYNIYDQPYNYDYDYEEEYEVTTSKPLIRSRFQSPRKYQRNNQVVAVTTTSSTTTTTTQPPTTRQTNFPQRRLPVGFVRPATKSPDDVVTTPASFPARPPSVHPTPQPYLPAEACKSNKCLLPDCRCGGSEVPEGLSPKDIPQIVLLTFDDGINDLNSDIYKEIFTGRTNPNGCPILGTFYVSHEWTDYGRVQTLYSQGHEMASHTISHSFGEKFSKSKWLKEVAGQREILHLYGGVKLEDVRGMRAPFLQSGGNNMFQMLHEANFTYDSSLPVYQHNPPFWPYTFDYSINHECAIPPCPTKSFPGLWEVGMVMWDDLRGGRCSMVDACASPPDEEGVIEFLSKNFYRHYDSNRAPFGLFYHSAWFNAPHRRKGFIKFLNEINSKDDVWIITNWQMLQWMRDPTPISKIAQFEPWKCNRKDLPPPCHRPKSCEVSHKGSTRYMNTCQRCPAVYPWVGKTGF
ncbi:uncharacterized protein LOC106467097 [Limulus polyphemus]|uniref:Uncharacterized protein LOC106467097 n=1 Tax=Limulus polyphemus TaxID=6850 RepID=A0ABM1BIV5_LIMPO|nr:uncharacterized protein LOC106467097 [Limulus polyphemus]